MMALPSSSFSSISERKYHVFLSFRGEDTRKNFTSHLDAALRRNKIKRFIDNDLHRGDEISESLLNAIEESEIAIIIFSEGYATSRWCLEELEKILECKKMLNLIVIPVFYQVDPSVVRNQTRTFGEAFVMHEERFEKSSEKVQSWRAAFTEAANLSGFDSNVIRSEAELIEEIIKNILEKLNLMSPSYNEDLVGVESSMREIELLLHLESKDVRSIGLWGMGGIGKTTLAHAVYDKISSQFESYHFVEDVREYSEKGELPNLRKNFLSATLEGDKDADLKSIFTKGRLRRKKILIVLDDVSDSEQIVKIVGDLKCFGPGSRIIITSRDRHVLNSYEANTYNIYEVKELLDVPALQLFRRHAFKLNHPTTDYMQLSQEVVGFAKGVPLALKVLGGFLCGKTIKEWESTMHKLELNPNPKIMNVLKISFNGLDEEQKTIFLDIACLLKGVNKNIVTVLYGLNSEINVRILIDKALIAVTATGHITMHDLLQEMGKKIVNEKSEEPGDRSRLWRHEDIYHVLKKNKGTKEIEGICLDMSKIKNVNLEPSAFSNMHKLRFLDFCCCNNHLCPKFRFIDSFCQPKNGYENKVHAPQGLEFGCAEPSYFRWFRYPLKSLPTKFDPENLVALSLPHSNIEQIFNGVQQFDKLKCVDLSYSKQLTRIPDLSFTPNLESLNLEGCKSLIEITLPNQKLEKLKYVNLSYLKKLITIPDLSLIPNLEILILRGCTSLIEVPSSIQYLEKLVDLNLGRCKSLSSLPTSFQSKSLTNVFLNGCSNLKKAPKITSNMKEVWLDGTSMTELPLIEYPSSLTLFWLQNGQSLSSTIWKLQSLSILSLSGCSILSNWLDNFGNSGLSSLEYLYLTKCQITKLPDGLGQLCKLRILRLSGSNFDSIPSLSKLSSLRALHVSNCRRLQSLPDLPSRADLWVDAYNCTSLNAISDSLFSKKRINLGNCFKLDQDMLKAKLEKALQKFQPKGEYEERDIMFPGNEIPDWFGVQNMGSSITLEIPSDYTSPGFMYKESIWIAMCLVVTFHDYNEAVGHPTLGAQCIGRDKYGRMEQLHDIYFSSYKIMPKDCYLTSDHVALQYNMEYSALVLNRQQGKIVDFDVRGGSLTFNFFSDRETNSYEVKKYGIKLLRRQDGSYNSKEEDEEQEEEEEQKEEEEEEEENEEEEEEEEEEEQQPKRQKI